MVGYGISKFKFKGKKLILLLVIITMVVPPRTLQLSFMQHFTSFDIGKVISWNYKGIIELITGTTPNITSSFWPFVILSLIGCGFKNGLYIFMMMQFFKGVPDELEESAYVDGSGPFRTFWQIIIPLSVPMMVTIFLFAFSWQWTDEFYTGMFIPSVATNKIKVMSDVYKTIPKTLQSTVAGHQLYDSAIQNTAGMMIIAPLIIVYLFGQKYLVQGIERTGLVG
jgi:multiple sugar transport system permease protein